MRTAFSLLCFSLLTLGISAPTTAATALRKIHSQAPEKDESVSCLGPEGEQICCRNCTSCCQEQNQCNFGEGNSGWGNVGDDNFGDFNIANNTFGDCNMEDDSYGIGGPEYNGCAKEVQEHIVRYCSINPYYIKCHTPPSYYGEELIDELRTVVLRCDSNIKVQPKQSFSGKRRRKRTPKAKMPRTRVARTASTSQAGDGSSEHY